MGLVSACAPPGPFGLDVEGALGDLDAVLFGALLARNHDRVGPTVPDLGLDLVEHLLRDAERQQDLLREARSGAVVAQQGDGRVDDESPATVEDHHAGELVVPEELQAGREGQRGVPLVALDVAADLVQGGFQSAPDQEVGVGQGRQRSHGLVDRFLARGKQAHQGVGVHRVVRERCGCGGVHSHPFC